jgi:hypothetical protein
MDLLRRLMAWVDAAARNAFAWNVNDCVVQVRASEALAKGWGLSRVERRECGCVGMLGYS